MKIARIIAGGGIAALLATIPASAQDIVAGWEGDPTQGYVFAAPTASIGLAASQSMLLRATGSLLYYGSKPQGPVDVIAPGASVALGYRVSTQVVNAAVVAGFEQRQIRRRLPAGDSTSWEHGPSASAELFVSPSPLTQVSALANYGDANRYTWGRVGVRRQLTNTRFTGRRALSLGVEVTRQGNRDVNGYQVGGVIDLAWLAARSSLQVHAGYASTTFANNVTERRPYIGVGVYRHF